MTPSAPRLDLPGVPEIELARDRIGAEAHWTPLLSFRTLGERTGTSVWLKCECLQRSGSFKFRGALNACLAARERDELADAGVLTYSSGNHGQALALAARLTETRATIVVPEDIPAVKRAAIAGYGAELVEAGTTSADRHARALEIAETTGARIIPPFDHPDIIAGQATTGLEIAAELPEADAVLVPVGGGGLLAGIALAMSERNPSTRIIGVEPESANGMALSLAAGEVVTLSTPPRTIADGLRPLAPGELTFEAAQRHVSEILLVDDESIRAAQELLLERAKLLVEPSGAAGVAAILRHAEQLAGLRLVVVLTGGNTAPPVFTS